MSANIWNHTPANERRAAAALVDAMGTTPHCCGVYTDPNETGGVCRSCGGELVAASSDAYARRHGLRPLKPPPVKIERPRLTAGQAELAREVRDGTYNPRTPRWG